MSVHQLLVASIALVLFGSCLPHVYSQATSDPTCNYTKCPLIFCHNNATSQTLHCIYDNCFEDYLQWAVENGLTIPHTTRNYSHHISHKIFSYSSLPFGYHTMSVFYKYYSKDSGLGRVCNLHHCSCSISVTLDVSANAHATRADIKLNGRSSKLSLEVASRKKIDFRNLLQSMRTVLKEVERHHD